MACRVAAFFAARCFLDLLCAATLRQRLNYTCFWAFWVSLGPLGSWLPSEQAGAEVRCSKLAVSGAIVTISTAITIIIIIRRSLEPEGPHVWGLGFPSEGSGSEVQGPYVWGLGFPSEGSGSEVRCSEPVRV